ncbi:MAG: winged helix-turn-helix domain-containing protein [Methanoregula sp.]|jgi:predicted transcriptional regulator|nr:winged helix-turn-helix domain-containing protein [Methanoregula sp.]
MNGRRSPYEIYWEILVYCKSSRSFTAIINRCDLNSKTGQGYLEFLVVKGYLSLIKDGEKSSYGATERASEYIALFTEIYQNLFDTIPGFRL